MQDYKIEYDEIDAILAVRCLRVSDIEVSTKLDFMLCLLNGKWQFNANYNGFSSKDRLCEIASAEGCWMLRGDPFSS